MAVELHARPPPPPRRHALLGPPPPPFAPPSFALALSPTLLVVSVAAAGVALVAAAAIALVAMLCREKPHRYGSFSRSRSMCGSTSFRHSSTRSPEPKICVGSGKPAAAAARNWRTQVFTYRELEQATDGFSEGNIVGVGGYGVVYRGMLADGTLAAVKRLQQYGRQREREFRVEVDLLSRLHSRYLVGLLGYCADQNHRLLVFEYMPSGSLKQHLHPTSRDVTWQPLSWKSRLRIALDCARSLEFLHEHSVPTVIHRDFKCSNILLDNCYRAKVSDFGLATIGSDKMNGQVITRVLGTTGYLAPEYASTGRLTTKSDVYSYGVVLLELLTGRVPVDTKRPPGEHVLVSWALPRLTNREKVVEMVDPALKGQYSLKDLIQVAAIAAVCIQSEADYRPLMTDVVQSLIPLVKTSTMLPGPSARSSSCHLPDIP